MIYKSIKRFFSIRLSDRELRVGDVVNTKYGLATITSGVVNVRLCQMNGQNIIAQNGGGFSVPLDQIKRS